jgi:hypothetical protein
MKEEDELDILEYRFLHARAKRAPAPEPAKAEQKQAEKPEIHVHVALPEVKDAPKPESPRRWKFTHRYDNHNKLIETTATAE